MTQNPDNDSKNDAAWDLLLEARKVEVSSFFARNVLREIRLMDDAKSSGWRSILSLPRLLTGAAAAALVVAIIVVSDQNGPSSPGSSPIAQQSVPIAPVEIATPVETFDMSVYEDEIEMIDYLDGLLAVQDVSALDDEALSELLF